MLTDFPAIPIQELDVPWLHQGRARISVLRLDLCDPLLSGNKFFKLKFNLQQARQENHDTLLSFGGYWSNHLHALAAAGQRYGLRTIGVVRGERPQQLNACLRDAESFGMQLHFISRELYRRRHESSFHDELFTHFGRCLLIPEGGANLQGVRGCQEILAPEQAAQFSHLLLACGTGTTMTGLISSVSTPVTGIQVLKGRGYLQSEIAAQLEKFSLPALAPWQVLDQFHCGGYARSTQELRQFLQKLAQSSDIPFEPVYSGKVVFALGKLLEQGFFPPDSHILLIHGGGLQGLRGSPDQH